MSEEEVIKAIMNIPKVKTNNPISSMNGINVEDLMEVVDKFNKVPTYDELLKENKNLQQELTKCTGKIKVLEHNCKQAEESCRQHRLSNKNKIRRLKRREEQITKLQQELTKYKERNDKAFEIAKENWGSCMYCESIGEILEDKEKKC